MVEPLGHLALALLFALPAWILWDGRTGGLFVAFVLVTATIPDVDLVLKGMGFGVKHHGVTHTIVFVVGLAIAAGVVAAHVLRPTIERWWHLTEDSAIQRGTLYLFVTGGLALGGLSHLLGDMLAAVLYSGTFPIEHRYRHWRRELSNEESPARTD